MRKKKTRISNSFFALLIATIAGIIGYNFLSTTSAPAVIKEKVKVVTKKSPTIEIIVANQEIQIGKKITINDIAWRQWPEDLYNASFIRREGDSEKQLEQIVNSVARFPINQGEPIVADKIIRIGDRGRMTSMLRQGMRALSVKISAQNGAGGFVIPGDTVDVLFTGNLNLKGSVDQASVESVAGFVGIAKNNPEKIKPKIVDSQNKNLPSEAFYKKLNSEKGLFIAGGDKYTETLLGNVKVLAIDRNVTQNPNAQQGEENGYSSETTATLEVTPEQAKLLAWAEKTGELTIILRSFVENAVSENENQMDILPETTSEYTKALNETVPYGGNVGQQKLSVLRSGKVSEIETSATALRSSVAQEVKP